MVQVICCIISERWPTLVEGMVNGTGEATTREKERRKRRKAGAKRRASCMVKYVLGEGELEG